MTPETERRVPEHPGWRHMWERFAAFGDHAVIVIRRADGGYAVAFAKMTGPNTWTDQGLHKFHSPAEAEAAFELACERLREGA